VIYVSFQKSFTSKVLRKLGGGFVDYQMVEGHIDDNKVIVQYKSLMRLKICYLDKTILIVDEAESRLTQIESLQTNCDNIFTHWIVFDNLIKNLAKVIAVDANTGFRAYDLLASSHKHVHMINNLSYPSPKEAPIDMYYDKPEAFFAAMVTAAIKAMTALFVIVSTLRTQVEVIHKHCLDACPDAVIKKYNFNPFESLNLPSLIIGWCQDTTREALSSQDNRQCCCSTMWCQQPSVVQ